MLYATTSKADDGITQNATYTGEGGQSITESGSVTRIGNTVDIEATVTGPKGQTVLYATPSKADDGITQNATYTGEGGQSITESGSVTRIGNTVNIEATVTSPEGKIHLLQREPNCRHAGVWVPIAQIVLLE